MGDRPHIRIPRAQKPPGAKNPGPISTERQNVIFDTLTFDNDIGRAVDVDRRPHIFGFPVHENPVVTKVPDGISN